ncbi:hypothetical protein [Staphylococcus shinii]|uniref:hypothetical protein n=1 Tax=Staphylococcus shinii TaxID=2912228 RepID=UPI003F564207
MMKVKYSKKKIENIIAFSMIIIIYLIVMTVSYATLDYIIKGKYKSMVTDNTMGTIILGKDKVLEYVGNIGIGVSILCVILMIVSTIFMVLLILGAVSEWKNKEQGAKNDERD